MSYTNLNWSEIWQLVKDERGEQTDDDQELAIRGANAILRNWRRQMDLNTVVRFATLQYIPEFQKYAQPSDMKEAAIIDIQNLNGRTNAPVDLVSPYRFKRMATGNHFALARNYGKQFILLRHQGGESAQTVISEADTATGWTGSNGASNLSADTDFKQSGLASLKFDISAATTARVTLALTTAVDLSDYSEQTKLRLFAYLPSITNLSSITIQWGSSSANYYEQTITVQASGEALTALDFQQELEVSRASATITGTPNDAAITHFQFKLNHSSAATVTNFRIDRIVAFKGEMMETEYYSTNTVQTSSGTWQDGFTESASTAANEIPLISDDLADAFVKELSARLMGPENNKRRKELLEEAKNIKEEYLDKNPSRRKRPKRSWLLPVQQQY